MKKLSANIQRIICFLSLIFVFPPIASAQNQNIWVWGTKIGLNFNFSNPVATLYTNLNPAAFTPYAYEAGTSVCNNSGQLLFYTEGSVVYNRQQNIMPNGLNLVTSFYGMGSPTSSSSQGAVIVPFPGQAGKYYIFSMFSSETGEMGKLFYSVADMSLDGGLGDIVVGQKGILIDTGYTEQMAAIYHCGNYWLITIAKSSGLVSAYPITSTGIGTPVNSPLLPASVNINGAGIIKFSTDGKKIAIASGGVLGLNLFDFNSNTGILSNQQIIDQTLTTQVSGVAFSPDNRKLYISADQNKIYQYDLDAGNILASRVTVYTDNNPVFLSQMKLAPNGKIYFSGTSSSTISGSSYLSTINQPNAQGPACQLQINSLPLASGSYHHMGMPAEIPMAIQDTILSSKTIQSCNFVHELTPEDTAGTSYYWNDGLISKTRNVSVTGTYWVRYHSVCGFRTDTFHVVAIPPVTTQLRKVLCGNQSVKFGASTLTSTGLYRDTLKTTNGCDSIVTLDLIVIPPQNIEIGFTLPEPVCLEDSILFEGKGAQLYSWYINDKLISYNNPSFLHLNNQQNEIMLVGTSKIEGADASCIDTVYANVNAISCCNLYIPNAFSPNGDGKNDILSIKTQDRFKGFIFEIYNRWGQLIFSTNQPSVGWDGSFSGKPVDMGVYHYYVRYVCDDQKIRTKKGDVIILR